MSLFSGSSVLNVQQNIVSCVEAATKKGSGGGEEKRWCEVREERAGGGRAGRSSRGREGDEDAFKQAGRLLCAFAV